MHTSIEALHDFQLSCSIFRSSVFIPQRSCQEYYAAPRHLLFYHSINSMLRETKHDESCEQDELTDHN